MRCRSRINGDIECPLYDRGDGDAGFGHQSLGAASIAFGFNWSRSATLSPGEKRFGAKARADKRFAEKDHLEPIPAGRTSDFVALARKMLARCVPDLTRPCGHG